MRSFPFFRLAACLAILANQSLPTEEPKEWAKTPTPELVELYQHFHSHPELSFQEIEILNGAPTADDCLPEASSIRGWLQRLGLYALTERLEPHGDWVKSPNAREFRGLSSATAAATKPDQSTIPTNPNFGAA